MLGSLAGLHVIQVVVGHRTKPSTEQERKQREFETLVEQSNLSPVREMRLMALMEELATLKAEELWQLQSCPTSSERGFMSIPRSWRLEPSRFLDCDSEDPATFLPMSESRTSDANIPVWEKTLVRNASGHGPRLCKPHVGRQ